MNARELHDWLHAAIARNDSGAQASITVPNGDWRTILSALSLLAAAEANDGTTPETDDCAEGDFIFDALEVHPIVLARIAAWRLSHAKLELSRNGLAAEVVRLTDTLRASILAMAGVADSLTNQMQIPVEREERQQLAYRLHKAFTAANATLAARAGK